MTTLLDRISRSGPLPPGDAAARPAVLAGGLAAVQAAAASAAAVLVPAVVAWTAAPTGHASWTGVVRVALDLWLLGHHAAIAVPGGQVGLVPLGLLIVPLLSCWFAGVRLARGLDPNAAAITAGVGRSRPVRPPARALVGFVVGYALIATLGCVLATSGGGRPLAAQALVGAATVAALGAGAGAAAWPGSGARGGLALIAGRLPVPDACRRCLRAAALAVGVLLAAATMLLLLAIALGWHRVLLLQHALGPGIVGGVVLLLLQAALLPNAVVWAAAFLSGPGFAVGVGTSVTPGGTTLGALPALPLLGTLPAPGPHPGWLWAVLGVPVAAGGLAVLLGAGPEPGGRLLVQARDAGLTGVLAGALTGVLAWLSGGPAGPGRLGTAGPAAWQVAPSAAALVAAGALLAVGGRWLVRRWAGRPEPAAPAVSGSAAPSGGAG